MSLVNRPRPDIEDVLPAEVDSILISFARVFKMGTGIIRMTQLGEEFPRNASEYPHWRILTLNHHEFCREIRKLSVGDSRCMASDFSCSHRCFQKNDTIIYKCHVGLYDMVSPIKIGGHHVALVYLGQARYPKLTFPMVWDKYLELAQLSQHRVKPGFQQKLKKWFYELPEIDSEDKLKNIACLVQRMAELISQRGTRELVFKNLGKIGESLNTVVDSYSGLKAFLSCIEACLDCDTSSIFLCDDRKKTLIANAVNWNTTYEMAETIKFRTDEGGLVPLVAATGKTLLLRNEAEIKEIPSDHGYIRRLRNLHSFMGTPLRVGKETLGVLEVGSSKDNAFCDDDKFLIEAIAAQCSIFVKNVSHRHNLLRAISKYQSVDVLQVMATEIPSYVKAEGCSIFLRNESDDFAVLSGTSEFHKSKIGVYKYKEGEGLTGWVLREGRPMKIDGGRDCRGYELRTQYQEAEWIGKYHKDEPKRKKVFYRTRPFLAVPIIASSNPQKVLGVIRIPDRIDGNFSESDQNFLKVCAEYIAETLNVNNLFASSSVKKKRVFITHGRNNTVKSKITDFVRERLGLEPVLLERQTQFGDPVIDQFENLADSCCCAIILYTGDDLSKDGKTARPNVVHELGYFQAKFGRRYTFILEQEGVKRPSNLSGIRSLRFEMDSVESAFTQLESAMEDLQLIQKRPSD